MSTFSNNLVAKSGNEMANKYYCEKCDYVCNKKYNWNKHIATAKHLESINVNETSSNINELVAKSGKENTNFCCEKCNKKYNDRSGLWRHKQKCTNKPELETDTETNEIIQSEDITDKQLIMMLIKQNADLVKETTEFKSMMMKLLENGASKNIIVNKDENTT